MSEQSQLSFWGYDDDGRSAENGQRLIYFVECGNYIKIGFTTRDVEDRLIELECGNPQNLTVIGTLVARDGEDDHRLHKQFAMFHHRKEWFRKTPELMQAIESLVYSSNQPQNIRTVATPIEIQVPEPAWSGRVNFMFFWLCPSCDREYFTGGRFSPNSESQEARCLIGACHHCHTRVRIHCIIGQTKVEGNVSSDSTILCNWGRETPNR